MRARKAPAAIVSAPPEQMVRAAWLYYAESMTQVQIARLMRISRAKVIGLLSAARNSGLVRIRIDAKSSAQLALERRLVERFSLQRSRRRARAGPRNGRCARRRPRRGHVSRRSASRRHVDRRRLGRDVAHEPEGDRRPAVQSRVRHFAARRYHALENRDAGDRRAAVGGCVRCRLLSADRAAGRGESPRLRGACGRNRACASCAIGRGRRISCWRVSAT